MKQNDLKLVALLEDWADWQRSYKPRLGYPSRSLTCYSEGSQDFESLCDAVDSQTFASVDACVQDLMPAQRAAVMRRYGIAAVFRFPRDNYEQCLLMAHEVRIKALPRKGDAVKSACIRPADVYNSTQGSTQRNAATAKPAPRGTGARSRK